MLAIRLPRISRSPATTELSLSIVRSVPFFIRTVFSISVVEDKSKKEKGEDENSLLALTFRFSASYF
jgi:hypothetical protein